MPYRRYTRRSTNYRRRRTARLSKYNTYRHRSSAAQASQIYNLARRVNHIQRLNKPEIKLAHYNVNDNLTFTDQISQSVYKLLTSGTSDLSAVIDGKFARLNSMTLTMSFRYDDSSYVVTTETTQRLPQPIYLRLLIVQTKASRQSNIDSNELFDATNGFTRTRGPLADGSARIVKILSDKKLMINFNRQTVNRVIRFKYLRNYYKPTTEGLAKGDVLLFLQCWNPLNVNDSSTNVILTFNAKTAYTDA